MALLIGKALLTVLLLAYFLSQPEVRPRPVGLLLSLLLLYLALGSWVVAFAGPWRLGRPRRPLDQHSRQPLQQGAPNKPGPEGLEQQPAWPAHPAAGPYRLQ